jgi:hypothetical protein
MIKKVIAWKNKTISVMNIEEASLVWAVAYNIKRLNRFEW